MEYRMVSKHGLWVDLIILLQNACLLDQKDWLFGIWNKRFPYQASTSVIECELIFLYRSSTSSSCIVHLEWQKHQVGKLRNRAEDEDVAEDEGELEN